jgi:hypothetical protein
MRPITSDEAIDNIGNETERDAQRVAFRRQVPAESSRRANARLPTGAATLKRGAQCALAIAISHIQDDRSPTCSFIAEAACP